MHVQNCSLPSSTYLSSTESFAVDPSRNASKAALEDRLNDWVNNRAIGGNKDVAKSRILDCFNNQSEENQLLKIPSSFGLFVEMKFLDIADNQLTELPLSLTSLVQLEWLHLNNNKLTSIPSSF